MKKLSILVYICFLFISACSDSKPREVLNKHQMASMLIEMYIKEAEINELGVRPDSANLLHQLMLNRVLEKKNITEDVYIKSYEYYLENLRRFDEVYAIVIDSLKLRETLAQQRHVQPRVEPDFSIGDVFDPSGIKKIGPPLPPFDSMLYIVPFDSITPLSSEFQPVEPEE
jgi:hypothetical protein